jgi:hypothetical protein
MREWVHSTFVSLGLHTYDYRSNNGTSSSLITSGILRAAKSDGKDALALVVDYHTGNIIYSHFTLPSNETNVDGWM